jgi:hypothetical protein
VDLNQKIVREHPEKKNMGCITIDYTNLMLNGKETKIKITTDEIPYMYYLQTKLSLTFVNRGLT